MIVAVVGLGAIGHNMGLRLLERGHTVVGVDTDVDRIRHWVEASGAAGVTSIDQVDWSHVNHVVIAVRMPEQVFDCGQELAKHANDYGLSLYVVTTLAASQARDLLPVLASRWRAFEAPVSGGPDAARNGSQTICLAGPDPNVAEQALLADVGGTCFRTADYGQPALLKLLNNTLGAYNAQATACMIQVANHMGVNTRQFLTMVNASSGRSWMSENFCRFPQDLLFKDVRLLCRDVDSLPEVSLERTDHLQELIQAARRLL